MTALHRNLAAFYESGFHRIGFKRRQIKRTARPERSAVPRSSKPAQKTTPLFFSFFSITCNTEDVMDQCRVAAAALSLISSSSSSNLAPVHRDLWLIASVTLIPGASHSNAPDTLTRYAIYHSASSVTAIRCQPLYSSLRQTDVSFTSLTLLCPLLKKVWLNFNEVTSRAGLAAINNLP